MPNLTSPKAIQLSTQSLTKRKFFIIIILSDTANGVIEKHTNTYTYDREEHVSR